MANIFAKDVLFIPSIFHILAGLVFGALVALSYWLSDNRKRPSQSFIITMLVLPSVISIVVSMVGSNMAKAVSIAGVFALVRFRSVPGDSRDIFYVFLAMASGLAAAMECYLTGLLLVFVLGIIFVVMSSFETRHLGKEVKLLKITIPENLNIKGVFDDVFKKYLISYRMLSVKTTNMGTLFQLTYEVVPSKDIDEKAFLDELRILNGNLQITLGYPEAGSTAVL